MDSNDPELRKIVKEEGKIKADAIMKLEAAQLINKEAVVSISMKIPELMEAIKSNSSPNVHQQLLILQTLNFASKNKILEDMEIYERGKKRPNQEILRYVVKQGIELIKSMSELRKLSSEKHNMLYGSLRRNLNINAPKETLNDWLNKKDKKPPEGESK